MSDEIKEVIKDIAALKKALLEKNAEKGKETFTYQGDHEAKKAEDRKGKVVTTELSDLKRALIAVDPKIVTENMLPFSFAERFKSMYEELQKEPWTEYLEAMGLDGLAAAWEKYQESRTDETIQWRNWLYAALGGMILALVVPVIALLVASKFTDLHRSLQALIFRRNRILALNENGQVRLQNRTDVENRERRVANGGTSLADLVADPANAARTAALREQLEKINPELLKFNNRAPTFIQQFRKLPSESKATKAAQGVEKVSKAIADVNHANMRPVAEGVNKINNAMRNADHRKIAKVATALGKLKDAMDGFEPTRLPKSSDLGPAATKMGELATETGKLRTKFEELRGTITSLDQVIGAATAG